MTIKKISSLVLALVLVLALAAPASAAVTGTITINEAADHTPAAGRSFAAYKILDVTLAADGVTPAYSVPDSMKTFYASYFTLTLTGKTPGQVNKEVTDKIAALNAAGMEAFAEAALVAAQGAGIVPEAVLGGVATTVPYGYYVIEQTSPAPDHSRVSAVMVDTTNPNATIALKADTPEIDKAIVLPTTPATTADTSDGAIGDTVDYKVTTKVPDMTGFTHYFFVIKDKLSAGLTFNGAVSVKVVLDGVELTKGADDSTGAYHVKENADGSFEIVFHNFIQYKPAKMGKDIVVTYSATINEGAVIGVAGNPNDVTLVYSNNPGKEGTGNYPDPESPVGETPPAKTKTFVTAIELTKIDKVGKAPLTGAKFSLSGTSLNKVLVTGDVFTADDDGTYYLLKDGTYTTTAPTADTLSLYVSEAKYIKETKTVTQETPDEVKAEGWVGPDGKLRFTGLSEGTYTLTELISPLGYNLLTAPIEIVITADLPAAITTGAETATWKASIDGGAETTYAGGIITLDVENNKGQELPSTGGMGTTLFTIGGLVLMAGVVLLALRRRSGATK